MALLALICYDNDMSDDKIVLKLGQYKKSADGSKLREEYLRVFEKKMIYRTTKSENPSTTIGMVTKVLNKLAAKS